MSNECEGMKRQKKKNLSFQGQLIGGDIQEKLMENKSCRFDKVCNADSSQ